MYFVGKKRWEAFIWLIVMECLWIIFALQTGTYGFIIGSLAYMIVYIRNARLWRVELSRASGGMADAVDLKSTDLES